MVQEECPECVNAHININQENFEFAFIRDNSSD